MTSMSPREIAELADRVEARAIEYATAALEDRPWDEEEREKLWTADAAFRVADRLRSILQEEASHSRAILKENDND